jgi:hypothetical protein
MRAPRCWLVNSGTTEDPWTSQSRYHEWQITEGEVHGFAWEPTGITVGDFLMHRAVGSDGDRIVAIGEVTGRATNRGHGRWPWRLPRRLLHVCPSVMDAPTAAELGIEARGVRTYKELPSSAARRAIERLRAVGHPYKRP